MPRFEELLEGMGRALGLCCHREVGNIPPEMLRTAQPRIPEMRSGRLR